MPAISLAALLLHRLQGKITLSSKKMGNIISIHTASRDFWGAYSPTVRNLILSPRLIFCKVSWLQYKLGKGEIWPVSSTIDFDTILEVDLFCHSQGKWMEVSYSQSFMAFRDDPKLCTTSKLGPSVFAILHSTAAALLSLLYYRT